jgi:hypothetical protein
VELVPETNQEKADRLAEYIRKLGKNFKIYTNLDGEHDHIGATIADAILP